MSCYEEAEGTIRLPAAEAASFRRDIGAAVRKLEQKRHEAARDIWRKIRAEKDQPKNAYEVELAIERLASVFAESDDKEDAYRRLIDYNEDPEGRLCRPKKTDPFNLRAAQKTLSGDDWQIRLDGRNVHVRVFENNHACERALHDQLFKVVTARLQRVTWLRGSGGVINRTDEHARDAGAGWRPWLTYGPKKATR